LNIGLSSLTSLTTLDVGDGLTDLHCPTLARLPSLTWLELETCHITHEGLRYLTVLPLQSLYVGGMCNLALHVIGQGFPALSFLKFGCIDYADYHIWALWGLTRLHSLWLHNCDTLHNFGNTFDRFHALQELQLTECELPVAAVENLATGKFRKLFIEHSTLSNAGLPVLAQTATLRTLSLRSCAYLTDVLGGAEWPHIVELAVEDCPQIANHSKRASLFPFAKPTTDVVADLSRNLGCDCSRCANLA